MVPRRLGALALAALLSVVASVSNAAPLAQPGYLLPLTASNVPCVGSTPEKMRGLHTEVDQQSKGYIRLASHPCNGGLYFATSDSDFTWILHEGWWLNELVAVYWLDANTLRIGASFYTGAGPQAAKPFNVAFTLRRGVDGWSLDGPELLQRDFDLPEQFALHGLHAKAFRVDTVEQLGSLRSKLQVELDFSRQRLWIVPITLNSGSITVEQVEIRSTHSQYVLSWRLTSPIFGTADMNPTLIWAVVPKDHRTLTLKNDFYSAPCRACTTGRQHHAWVTSRLQDNQSINHDHHRVKPK